MHIATDTLKILKFVTVWALVIFFIAGSIGNIFPPDNVQADYERWGYPDWFHYVTGALEFIVAILIVRPATRLIGSAMGCLIMGAAFGTLLFHGEYSHAAAPTVILLLLFGCIVFTTKDVRRNMNRGRSAS